MFINIVFIFICVCTLRVYLQQLVKRNKTSSGLSHFDMYAFIKLYAVSKHQPDCKHLSFSPRMYIPDCYGHHLHINYTSLNLTWRYFAIPSFLLTAQFGTIWHMLFNSQHPSNIFQGSTPPLFFRTFCFSLNLTGTLTKNCTLPLVNNGKIGNTSCLIGNLHIIGYMHIFLIRTTFIPS